MCFGLTVEFVHDLRAGEMQESGIGFIGDDFGEQGLAAAGWAVKKDAFGGIDPQTSKDTRKAEWKFDHLADALYLIAQSTDILISQARFYCLSLAGNGDAGLGCDDDGA